MRISTLITDNKGQPNLFPFPPNEAQGMPVEFRKKVVAYILSKYAWPLIMARRPYEAKWDKYLAMAKAQPNEDVRHARNSKVTAVRNFKLKDQALMESDFLSSPVVADSVDRLTALNYFVSFKEDMPGRFQKPDFTRDSVSNQFYTPQEDKVNSWNAWLSFNAAKSNLRLNWRKACVSRYTYGVSLILSDFKYRVGTDLQWVNKKVESVDILKDVGVSFEPISIRRVWLNPSIPLDSLHLNPCIFYYSMVNRADLHSTPYDEVKNPFGFSNLSTKHETSDPAVEAAFNSTRSAMEKSYGSRISFQTLSNIFQCELMWTFHVVLPIAVRKKEVTAKEGQTNEDLQNLQKSQVDEWILDEDGKEQVTPLRYIVSLFGDNLFSGSVDIVRFQRNYYPEDYGPIYGSAQKPDTESGAYPSSAVSIVEPAYDALCKAMDQYFTNKDLINDPPHTIQHTSPAINKKYNLNEPGGRIPVNTQNDIKSASYVDATQTTPQMVGYLTDSVQTSLKTTEAILGKAMGARTSATEASNVFQTAMSGITSDIDGMTGDLFEPYARRVVIYSRFLDPDVLHKISGYYSLGVEYDEQALLMHVPCNAGTRFIEKLTMQGHVRYILESSRGEPGLNRSKLWKICMSSFGLPDGDKIVTDDGLSTEINLATSQAERSYLGELVVPDPAQDHQTAIQVKMSFIKDRNSHWNKKDAANGGAGGKALIEQISIHQQFLQILQMQRELLPSEQQQQQLQ